VKIAKMVKISAIPEVVGSGSLDSARLDYEEKSMHARIELYTLKS
jgi:hypothetical protein